MPKIIPLQNLEDNRNKVTVIDDTASDEQYPSAKAVFDRLKKVDLVSGYVRLSEEETSRARGNLGVCSSSEVQAIKNLLIYILYNMVNGEEVITFTIFDYRYFAAAGMSWKDWCDSDYNSSGFYYDSNNVYDTAGDKIYEPNTGAPDGVGYNVSPIATIKNGVAYNSR